VLKNLILLVLLGIFVAAIDLEKKKDDHCNHQKKQCKQRCSGSAKNLKEMCVASCCKEKVEASTEGGQRS